MGKLIYMVEGDTEVKWQVGDKATESVAAEQFRQLIAQGYTAFSVKSGKKDALITEFDPSLEEIIMAPRMVGG